MIACIGRGLSVAANRIRWEEQKMRGQVVLVGLLTVCLMLGPSPSLAGLDLTTGDPESYAGRWIADDGARLTIRVNDGLLEVWGEDAASNFHVDCIFDDHLSGRAFICSGSGYQHIERQPFIYSSAMRLGLNGTLVEEWTAKFWDETSNEVKTLTGTQSFKQGTR